MKSLAHFVPRAGAEEACAARVRELGEELAERGRAFGVEVGLLERVAEDPFGRHTPFRSTLELRDGDFTTVGQLVAKLGEALEDLAHPDLSTFLVGEDVVFAPPEGARFRYQYLMRRNVEFSRDAYLQRYREVHSGFGMKTPGIAGYVQFHVNVEASRRIASEAGLGTWGVDSVSELHLESVETFHSAVSQSTIGADAMADEEIFVDRARSLDFCSHVVR